MTNQEILDNAPKGATHYDVNCEFWDLRACNDHNKVYTEDGFGEMGWFQTDDNPPLNSLRSLADIRRIAELEDDLEAWRECFGVSKEQSE